MSQMCHTTHFTRTHAPRIQFPVEVDQAGLPNGVVPLAQQPDDDVHDHKIAEHGQEYIRNS